MNKVAFFIMGSIAVLLTISLLLIPQALKIETFEFNGFSYYICNNQAVIISYDDKSAKNIDIPAKIAEYKTSIGSNAFADCAVKSIFCGAERINNNGFANCQDLTTLILSPQTKVIEKDAFLNSPNIEYNVQNGLNYLSSNDDNPYFALVDVADQNINQVIIADSCLLIAEFALANQKSLEEVYYNSNEMSINKGAFYECTNIQKLIINTYDNLYQRYCDYYPNNQYDSIIECASANPLYYCHNVYFVTNKSVAIDAIVLTNEVLPFQYAGYQGKLSLSIIPERILPYGFYEHMASFENNFNDSFWEDNTFTYSIYSQDKKTGNITITKSNINTLINYPKLSFVRQSEIID